MKNTLNLKKGKYVNFPDFNDYSLNGSILNMRLSMALYKHEDDVSYMMIKYIYNHDVDINKIYINHKYDKIMKDLKTTEIKIPSVCSITKLKLWGEIFMVIDKDKYEFMHKFALPESYKNNKRIFIIRHTKSISDIVKEDVKDARCKDFMLSYAKNLFVEDENNDFIVNSISDHKVQYKIFRMSSKWDWKKKNMYNIFNTSI